MIQVRIKIGDGAIEDTFIAHNLIYRSSDNRTEAPIKKRAEVSYVEEAGKHTDPRTVQDAFDYKVQFIIDGQNIDLANACAIVAAFNAKLYTKEANSDIRTYKEVTFFNDAKRVKIVGLPEPIAEPEEMYQIHNGYSIAIVELVIHVSDPTKCDFNTSLSTNMYVIACAGSTARDKGHYLFAQPNGKLLHTNTLNDYSLWQTQKVHVDGSRSISNVGCNMWFVGRNLLSANMSSVVYVYDSPAIPSTVGFCHKKGAGTQENIFLNASNLDNNIGLGTLDENSSFVFVPYQLGDTDATLQAKLDNILQLG